MMLFNSLLLGINAKDVTEQCGYFQETINISTETVCLFSWITNKHYDLSNGVQNDNFEKYKELEEDIQSITLEYTKTFLDFWDTPDTSDFDIVKKNLVSMQAFTSYFDMDTLRYKEQTENLIKSLYIPFNTE